MRVKKPVRSKKPARAGTAKKTGKPARTKKSESFGSSLGAGAFILGLVAIVGIAMMLPDAAPADGHTLVAATLPDVALPATPTPASSREATPPKPATRATKAPTMAAAATVIPPAPSPTPTPAAENGDSSSAETPAPTPPPMVLSGAVTIDGCMQRDNEGFRLKDTSGEDAPRARSWKSGFLRKGAAPVTLVDVAGAHALASHVGWRVSVTGALVDREMRVHSLRRTGESCE